MAGIALSALKSQKGIPRPQQRPGAALPSSGVGTSGINLPRPGQQTPAPTGGTPLPVSPSYATDGGMTFNAGQPHLPATGIHEVLTPEGVRLQQMGPGGIVQGPVMGGGGPAATMSRSATPGPGGDGGAGGGGGASPPPADPTWGIADLQNLLRTFAPPDVPRIEPPAPEDERAAQSAAYGRAADRIRSIGRGSEKRMLSDLTRRGVSGTGLETKARTAANRGTQADLGQVVRDQAIQSLDRTQAVNDRNLNALIAQRGQDLGRSNWQLESLSTLMGALGKGLRPF